MWRWSLFCPLYFNYLCKDRILTGSTNPRAAYAWSNHPEVCTLHSMRCLFVRTLLARSGVYWRHASSVHGRRCTVRSDSLRFTVPSQCLGPTAHLTLTWGTFQHHNYSWQMKIPFINSPQSAVFSLCRIAHSPQVSPPLTHAYQFYMLSQSQADDNNTAAVNRWSKASNVCHLHRMFLPLYCICSGWHEPPNWYLIGSIFYCDQQRPTSIQFQSLCLIT